MKQTTIYINGKAFTYDDYGEDISYESIKPISREEASSLLKNTKKLFSDCGIFFFLAYGTLLGAVRDHNLIDGDEDVDVFIDDEKRLRDSLPQLYESGFLPCRIDEGVLYSFKYNTDAYIDVYILKDTPPGLWYKWCKRMGNYYFPKRCFSKFDKIVFLDEEYLIPHRPDRLFKIWYGKTWRTPIRGHQFECEELVSHYLWKKIDRRVRNIICK